MTEVTHKNCSRCELFLSIEKFYKEKRASDGHQRYCKKCDRRSKQMRKLENVNR